MLAAAGTGTAGTAASLIAMAVPAGAQSIGDCSTTTGVIVVVDLAHWGGTIERGCAADGSAGSTNGLQALHTAGFTTAGVLAYGTAFICRIDTKPTATQTSCTKTPPSTGYWSYWHADAGQTTWSYSQLGVRTYKPPPGSVTLWTFGGTNVTGTSGTGRPPATLTPTALRATNTTPSGGGGPTTTTTAAPPTTTSPAPLSGGRAARTSSTAGGSPTGGSGGAPTSGGNASGGGASSSPPAGSSVGAGHAGSTTSTTAATGTTTTTTAAGGGTSRTGGTNSTGGTGSKGGGSHDGTKGGHTARIVDADPASARVHPPSGSPLPVIIGGIAVVVVAGAAAVIAWRRRRTGQAG